MAGCPKKGAAAILLRLRRAVFVAVRDLGLSVLNSLVASRRHAYRMVTVQFVVAMLVALAFLAQNARSALAAAFVGGSVALGSLVLALRSLPATPKSAGWALSRMVSGLLLKWCLVRCSWRWQSCICPRCR